MRYVIRFAGMAFGENTSGVSLGSYLAGYDVDAHGGRGWAHWSANLDDALRFETNVAATEVWRKQSTVRPIRPDGKPNRPLTAFTVTIEREPS